MDRAPERRPSLQALRDRVLSGLVVAATAIAAAVFQAGSAWALRADPGEDVVELLLGWTADL